MFLSGYFSLFYFIIFLQHQRTNVLDISKKKVYKTHTHAYFMMH